MSFSHLGNVLLYRSVDKYSLENKYVTVIINLGTLQGIFFHNLNILWIYKNLRLIAPKGATPVN